MFRLPKEDEAMEWPVKVRYPLEGGGSGKAEFKVLFKLRSAEEIKALSYVGDKELLTEVVAGWRSGVQDHEGNEIPFSEKALEMVLNIPYACRAMAEAYFEFARGGAGKN